MFLSLNNDIELTSKYIKAVTYMVFAFSNRQEMERVTEPPFLLSRPDFGTFLMPCTLDLCDGTKIEINHYLSFENGGDIIRATLNLENDVLT